MLLVLQADPLPAGPGAMAPVAIVQAPSAGPLDPGPGNRALPSRPCPASQAGDVVVCARRTPDEQYRLRPIAPPPRPGNFLSRPLRVTLAPGFTFGLQPGGSIGFKMKFGPDKKDGDKQP